MSYIETKIQQSNTVIFYLKKHKKIVDIFFMLLYILYTSHKT